MKDTNAIEKALQQKISVEVSDIVQDFCANLDKLKTKYGGSMFYNLKESNASDARTFMVDGAHKVSNVLHRMILENHGEAMLKKKSQELLNKLEII
mgnify:FL=1|jgi:hypothetical protein|tara:strand:- start:127 stop:414 length:288 start_codon:yes stop_codon:yes gene_type:complete